MEHTFSPDIYGQLLNVVRDIGLDGDGTFLDQNDTVDTQFYIDENNYEFLKSIGHKVKSISVRELLNLLTGFFQNKEFRESISAQIYHITMESLPQYPFQYLLFDFCLAILGGDETDANLFLDHSYRICNMDPHFYFVLACVVKNHLTNDLDVRRLVTSIADAIEPISAPEYKDRFGDEYTRRFTLYETELQNLRK